MSYRDTPLRTGSLRWRVTWSTIAVIGIVLVLLMFIVQQLFGLQSHRDLKDRLVARADAVEAMARTPASPEILARKANSGGGIRGTIQTKDGREYPENVPSGEVSEPVKVTRQLPRGITLTLVGDAAETSAAQQRLARVLGLGGLIAVAATALVLVGTVRLSLRPLERMAGLARSIAGGDRGRRLTPTKPNTELGRTAAAFDQMLDALEGAEAQARWAEAQAKQSEEHARQFLADAAHELRTPIAGVQAAAEAVVQGSTDTSPEEQERMHVLLAREARRAGRLVEDLLSLARIDAGLELRREPVDLLALAEAEAERVRLLANGVQVVVSGQPAVVSGDPDRLGQVLANLLGNARRYSPKGGTVTVEVGHSPVSAWVQVADSGPGVPAADRARIFDRLVRLDDARDRSSGGAGLGLAIALGIARAHGGDLTCVEPPPGEPGAVFRLVLPVAQTRAPLDADTVRLPR